MSAFAHDWDEVWKAGKHYEFEPFGGDAIFEGDYAGYAPTGERAVAVTALHFVIGLVMAGALPAPPGWGPAWDVYWDEDE